MLTTVLWGLVWALVVALVLIGLFVVGLVLVAQFMPRESTGTFLSPTRPPDEQ